MTTEADRLLAKCRALVAGARRDLQVAWVALWRGRSG